MPRGEMPCRAICDGVTCTRKLSVFQPIMSGAADPIPMIPCPAASVFLPPHRPPSAAAAGRRHRCLDGVHWINIKMPCTGRTCRAATQQRASARWASGGCVYVLMGSMRQSGGRVGQEAGEGRLG
jgi:hypothetical protein